MSSPPDAEPDVQLAQLALEAWVGTAAHDDGPATDATDLAHWTIPFTSELMPHLIVVCRAGAPEEVWSAERRNGLGGSDIAAACGINPYETPYTLWLDKTGRRTAHFDDKALERMKWGHLLEPVLRDEFQWLHPEYQVTTGEGTYALPGDPWQRINLDGLIWDATTGQLAGIWEGKTGTHWQLSAWEADEVPVRYTAQVQWAMHVTGARFAWVSALLDTSTYVEKVIVRDDELIADLVDLGTEMWTNVLTDTPPPADGSEVTRKALSAMTGVKGKEIELGAHWRPDVDRRNHLHDLIGALEAEKAEIDNRVRAAMGDAGTALVGGAKVATHNPTKGRKSTDYDRLAANHPAAYAECVDPGTPGRTLRYSKPTTTTTTTGE